jgi:hypothetical protein
MNYSKLQINYKLMMDKLHQLCMNDGGGGDVNNGDVGQ